MSTPARLLSAALLLVGAPLGLAPLGLALALGSFHRQGVLSSGHSMVPPAFPVLQRRGALFSTHHDRPSRGCSLGY